MEAIQMLYKCALVVALIATHELLCVQGRQLRPTYDHDFSKLTSTPTTAAEKNQYFQLTPQDHNTPSTTTADDHDSAPGLGDEDSFQPAPKTPRLLERPRNKYHQVLSSYDHQGVPQPSIFRGISVNPYEINPSGESGTKFGTTSSGNSPGGIGHSIGGLNDEDAEPKQALASSLSSAGAGATHFVTGFKGDFLPPSPASN